MTRVWGTDFGDILAEELYLAGLGINPFHKRTLSDYGTITYDIWYTWYIAIGTVLSPMTYGIPDILQLVYQISCIT